MKKLFALFLAFSFLFLTACNTNTPPVGTNEGDSTISGNQTEGSNTGTGNGTTGKPSSGNTSSGDDSYHWDWRETMQDQIVTRSSNYLIELPQFPYFAAETPFTTC